VKSGTHIKRPTSFGLEGIGTYSEGVLLIFYRAKFAITRVKVNKGIRKEICFREDLFSMLDTLDKAFDIPIITKTHSMEL
jgi:hypothetical protein